jgi:hypothetical protein
MTELAEEKKSGEHTRSRAIAADRHYDEPTRAP